MIPAPKFTGTMKERFVTFGTLVRGLRLGYGYSHKHQCFIRIDAEGPPWQITLAPNGGIPSRVRRGSGNHVVWWENSESKVILDHILPLANIRGVHKLVQFHVNYEGELV